MLTDKIKRLPEWPDVERGNYPGWDGGFNSALRTALAARLELVTDWMEGRMPCATGECCHELRELIAACKRPESTF